MSTVFPSDESTMQSSRSKRSFQLAHILLVVSSIQGISGTCGGPGFVCSSGSQLTLDGSPFYFIGANAYWVQDHDISQVDSLFEHCNEYGLKVVRFWAFNSKLPESRGVYDETQFQHLDYIIDSAGRYGIKLVMALGNFWGAYRSPEEFMQMAGVDPAGKDILDFYCSPEVAQFYREHMEAMVTRTNTINNLQYNNDPAVFMWDIFNEPRCPGCMDSGDRSSAHDWLNEMADYLRGVVPKQLIASGTEGFLIEDDVQYNPGAGSKCEGEDWYGVSQMANIDVATAHIYDRQMESVPPTWVKCDWTCYFSFFPQYLDKHIAAATSINKPLVIEEFNVILPTYTSEQRTAFFKFAYSHLLASQKSGGPLMGMMFWNAATGSVSDDGWVRGICRAACLVVAHTGAGDLVSYNIYLDLQAKRRSVQSRDQNLAVAMGASMVGMGHRRKLQDRDAIVANTEGLDSFRRGAQRSACSEAAAKDWMPAWNMSSVDASSILQDTSGKTVQQVIKETAVQLGSLVQASG